MGGWNKGSGKKGGYKGFGKYGGKGGYSGYKVDMKGGHKGDMKGGKGEPKNGFSKGDGRQEACDECGPRLRRRP